MFVKITKAGGYEYVKIVHNYRENGKIKQKVLLNLGRLDLLKNNESFVNVIDKLYEVFAKEKNKNATIELTEDNVSEGTILNYGYIVYRKLWELFRIDKFLEEYCYRRYKIKFDIDIVSFLMTVQRLLQPVSKLRTYEKRHQYFGFPLQEIDLNHLYRGLDILADVKEELEVYLYQKNRTLFNFQVDVVFYDVTTFYFESVKADELRKYGFSKDNKVNEVQVVMGMLIDKEGRPVGYELFAGNTIDSKTVIKVLEKLKEKFCIDKVVIVADKGINSKLNLKMIKEAGYDYIVASRLKSMSKEVLEEVFNNDGYRYLTNKDFESIYGEGFKFKVIDYENYVKDENGKKYKLEEKMVITYSSKRAKKDKQDRERFIEKAKELLREPSKIRALEKRGGKKFLKRVNSNSKEEYQLNEEAIKEDERFDGYYAIQTSKLDLTAEEILRAYHDLWKIEESFRVMKSSLEVRPIFHWTEKRIRGHFVVCFLAFLLERTLEFKLREKGKDMSSEKIKEAINSMNFMQIDVEGRKILLKAKIEQEAKEILQVMKIEPPKNLMMIEEALEEYGVRK
ncbi:IS1634 family transposase [Anaerocellum danielii]|uniref:IS1634 family transposase n=1 Tax=Anaerocellum danielii TaxID=1387557 RepID=A0ABZ0U0E4_9FIRM|nr:IS1634 family transposase [Caldicellulosiruptor danielii]WPX07795.1 IS1634 family transposase [Caldicellulosiruptor danielii]WPX07904.1 IS1634 family transposase [Caldicellulosiruptor danielii]